MRTIKWVAIIAAIMLGVSILFSVINTATTVATAPGRVIQKTLKTDNIINNYEWFFDVNAAYDARLSQVNQYRTYLSSETDKDEKYRIRTEVAAMQQTCRDLATKYNANSEKINTSIFKGWSLPPQLSINECN